MDTLKRSQIVAVLCTGLTVIGVTGCAMMPGHRDERSAGRWYDDRQVTRHVEKALDREPTYKFNDVDVVTFAGQVQLSGFVNSNEQKERAEQIARTVPGVEGVHNSLLLKPLAPAPTGRINDTNQTSSLYQPRLYSRPPTPRSSAATSTTVISPTVTVQTNQEPQSSQAPEQK